MTESHTEPLTPEKLDEMKENVLGMRYKTPTEPIVMEHPTNELLHRDFTEMLTTDQSRIFTVVLSRAEVAMIQALLSHEIANEEE